MSNKLLPYHIYMPCDSNHLIDVEYDEILCEIQALHIKHTCTYVMFGGDLNTDLSRYASMHTRSLLRFCTEEGVVCSGTLPGEAPKQKFRHMYLIFVALVRN